MGIVGRYWVGFINSGFGRVFYFVGGCLVFIRLEGKEEKW